MSITDDRKLYTSAEVCRACGISRTSLFRLEEYGFIRPYRVNPKTGYRYYDLHNITSIGQFQKLQSIGLTKKEITDVYYERVDSEKFIAEQRQKLNNLQHFLREYEYCHDHKGDRYGSVISLPAVTCYCAHSVSHSMEEAAIYNFRAHEKCVEEGYQLLGSEPIFGIIDEDAVLKDLAVSGVGFTFCIPVNPQHKKPVGENIRTIPEIQGFSAIVFGDYSVVPGQLEYFQEEISRMGLRRSGPTRIIMHVGSYAGSHYKKEDYCYEIVIPVDEVPG